MLQISGRQDIRAVSSHAPAVSFLCAVICVCVPMLVHPYLPLTDLPNHIARYHIVAAGEAGPLSGYYTTGFSWVPNISADVLWLAAKGWADPVDFARGIMAVYGVLLVASAMLLGRVIWGRWQSWSAVAGLVVYNGAFFWGFQNFLLAVPVAIALLALWLATERWRLVPRLALFVPLTSALCLLHFFAFAALAIAAFGREVQRVVEAGAGWRTQFTLGAGLAIPFVLPTGWTLWTSLASPAEELGRTTIFGGVVERIAAIQSITVASPAAEAPGVVAAANASLAVLALAMATLFLTRGPRLTLAPVLVGPVIALAVASLLAPSWLNGIALVGFRLPIVLAVVMIAGTQWRDLTPGLARGLALVVLALLIARGVTFERFAGAYSAKIADLMAVTEGLGPQDRLLPLRAEGREEDTGHWHLQAYATIAHDVFVPTLFQGSHTMRLKPEWRPYSHAAFRAVGLERLDDRVNPQPAFVIGWRNKFTHALLLDAETAAVDARPEFELLARQGRMSLFRVRPTP